MKKTSGMLFAVLLGACSTTPNYDAKFGDAVRAARLNMTINPEAGKEGDQVAGLDGKSGKEAVARYQSSFKEPPPVTNVINIGGTVGSNK